MLFHDTTLITRHAITLHLMLIRIPATARHYARARYMPPVYFDAATMPIIFLRHADIFMPPLPIRHLLSPPLRQAWHISPFSLYAMLMLYGTCHAACLFFAAMRAPARAT